MVQTAAEVPPCAAAFRRTDHKHAVENALPGVEKLILFGARGLARADSGCDIAVVVRDFPDRRHVRRILSGMAWDHILSGCFIRPIPLPPDYPEPQGRRSTELAEDIVRDGVQVTCAPIPAVQPIPGRTPQPI